MTETSSRFGRQRTLDGGWQDLGTRHERFEAQPPTDDKGDYPKLTVRQRKAFRMVQGAIDMLSDVPVDRNAGRRIGTTLPTLEQRRYEKWWRGQVASILDKTPAAETSAQVITFTPRTGLRRAA